MFLLILVYPIRFLGNFDVAKTIDTGTPGPVGVAVLVNLILLEVFVVPHSVMARPGFKWRWTQFVPKPLDVYPNVPRRLLGGAQRRVG